MLRYLKISATFLDGQFHGQTDGGVNEWPPSPLRVFQSLVAANSNSLEESDSIGRALRWLEVQPPPQITTPIAEIAAPYCLSVPNNSMDVVGRAWAKGKYFGKGDANPATHRTMKTYRPMRMGDESTVCYYWVLPTLCNDELMTALSQAADRVYALGWGIDFVVGQGSCVESIDLSSSTEELWHPTSQMRQNPLRIPRAGTLDELIRRHQAFLSRIGESGLIPVDPLRQFSRSGYERASVATSRPYSVLELREDNGAFSRTSQRRLMHIAGMTRHLAIDTMRGSPPLDVADPTDWVDKYVAGHARKGDGEHKQFSYVPLPSIGMKHTDPSIRRVMVVAPIGDDRWLQHLTQRLSGQQLEPQKGNEFKGDPPTLVHVKRDNVARFYTRPANVWASVTPVILPGHNDHRSGKTVKLIERSLRQSGIEQPCTFEWRATSWWPQSLSAHKYDHDKRPIGYFRPKHLMSQTAVHLKLRFNDNLEVPGPLTIGAGRHCGFGVMAGMNDDAGCSPHVTVQH